MPAPASQSMVAATRFWAGWLAGWLVAVRSAGRPASHWSVSQSRFQYIENSSAGVVAAVAATAAEDMRTKCVARSLARSLLLSGHAPINEGSL